MFTRPKCETKSETDWLSKKKMVLYHRVALYTCFRDTLYISDGRNRSSTLRRQFEYLVSVASQFSISKAKSWPISRIFIVYESQYFVSVDVFVDTQGYDVRVCYSEGLDST